MYLQLTKVEKTMLITCWVYYATVREPNLKVQNAENSFNKKLR